jgi:hypothetical protein
MLKHWNALQGVVPLPNVSKDSLTGGHAQVGWDQEQEGHLAVKFCTKIKAEHRDGDHNGVIAALVACSVRSEVVLTCLSALQGRIVGWVNLRRWSWGCPGVVCFKAIIIIIIFFYCHLVLHSQGLRN